MINKGIKVFFGGTEELLEVQGEGPKKETTLGLSSLMLYRRLFIFTWALLFPLCFSMGIATTFFFSHGRRYSAKEIIHDNQSKDEQELVCISFSSIPTIKQNIGFFRTKSCDPTCFRVRCKFSFVHDSCSNFS